MLLVSQANINREVRHFQNHGAVAESGSVGNRGICRHRGSAGRAAGQGGPDRGGLCPQHPAYTGRPLSQLVICMASIGPQCHGTSYIAIHITAITGARH